MYDRVPLTKKGFNELQKELAKLEAERPNIVRAIEEARAHGDLRENADYDAAKNRQGLVEAKIRKIQNTLSRAQIIDIKVIPNTGKVIFGVTVHLLNLDTEEKNIYQIVGEDEVDVKLGKISMLSPIGRNLIGKSIGDEVEINTPSGNIYYKIEKVEHI